MYPSLGHSWRGNSYAPVDLGGERRISSAVKAAHAGAQLSAVSPRIELSEGKSLGIMVIGVSAGSAPLG